MAHAAHQLAGPGTEMAAQLWARITQLPEGSSSYRTGRLFDGGIAMTDHEPSTADELGRLWPEPWASQGAMQAAVIKGELDRALASGVLSNWLYACVGY
jgi:hypothetical protein